MPVSAMSVAAGRADLLKTHLKGFNRILHGLEQGEVRNIHRARVASRRLRELVPVLQVDAHVARKLNRRLRKLTNRLGAVRELDVLLDLIHELNGSHRELSDPLSRVAVAVSKARDDVRGELSDDLPLRDMRRVAKRLTSLGEELAESDAARAAHKRKQRWRWVVDARVARRAQQLRAALADAGTVYLQERLHAVRIAVKKLRYAAELSVDIGGSATEADVRLFKRQQNTLGRMHDLEVLIDQVRQVQATLAPPNLAAWRALDRLKTSVDADCRRLHARFVRGSRALAATAARLSGVEQSPESRSARRAG
jgi:CHAD domain-containing protein